MTEGLKTIYVGKPYFRQRPDGRFELMMRYKNQDGEMKKKSFYGMSEYECFMKSVEFENNYAKEIQLATSKSTIPDILKITFKRDLELNYVKEQSYFRNMETLKIIERHYIGQMPIIQIQKKHMLDFLMHLTSYSNSTINKIYVQVKAAFRFAMEKGVIDENIMIERELRRPKSIKEDKVIKSLTEEEQKVFVEYIKNAKVPKGRNHYKNQLLVSLYSGLRMGEVNALTPEDIDLENRVIHVRTTVSSGEKGRSFISKTTKTYAGRRDVPISDILVPVLEESLSMMRKNKENLVFFNHKEGKVIATRQVNCYYRRVCEKIGLECHGQHSLRHTFATRCIESGVQPVVLKKWMGHRDIHVTLDTYADVFDRMNNNAINQFNAYVTDIQESN